MPLVSLVKMDPPAQAPFGLNPIFSIRLSGIYRVSPTGPYAVLGEVNVRFHLIFLC